MAELPSGTVTFLFSDVEASTQLLERHGAAMGSADWRILATVAHVLAAFWFVAGYVGTNA